MSVTDKIPAAIGDIQINLLSLEFLLRAFLYESIGPKDDTLTLHQLKEGDRVKETPLTSYNSLRDLIRKVNARLESLAVSERIDESLADIRDVFAHGRVFSSQLKGPFRNSEAG